MKVLVESKGLMNDLWLVDYSGEVIAETPERYLVKHHLILKTWVPIRGHLMRCVPITTPTKG